MLPNGNMLSCIKNYSILGISIKNIALTQSLPKDGIYEQQMIVCYHYMCSGCQGGVQLTKLKRKYIYGHNENAKGEAPEESKVQFTTQAWAAASRCWGVCAVMHLLTIHSLVVCSVEVCRSFGYVVLRLLGNCKTRWSVWVTWLRENSPGYLSCIGHPKLTHKEFP